MQHAVAPPHALRPDPNLLSSVPHHFHPAAVANPMPQHPHPAAVQHPISQHPHPAAVLRPISQYPHPAAVQSPVLGHSHPAAVVQPQPGPAEDDSGHSDLCPVTAGIKEKSMLRDQLWEHIYGSVAAVAVSGFHTCMAMLRNCCYKRLQETDSPLLPRCQWFL